MPRPANAAAAFAVAVLSAALSTVSIDELNEQIAAGVAVKAGCALATAELPKATTRYTAKRLITQPPFMAQRNMQRGGGKVAVARLHGPIGELIWSPDGQLRTARNYSGTNSN